MSSQGKDRIIVALDVDGLDKAAALVAELAPHVGMFKVGLELITAVGAPAAVACVKEAGGKVMFDGKFHDIPNTMAGAARAVSALGVDMFTIHASSGRPAIRAAVENAGAAKVIGVTVLTSLTPSECLCTFGDSPEDKVEEFAADLDWSGAHAVVCSPRELAYLEGAKRLIRITPGVRPEWAAAGDQQRVMTPLDAVLAGADFLVVGRPITNQPAGVGSRVDAASRVAAEIDAALERKAILKACIDAEGKGGPGC